ncbi:TPR protein, partial [Cettia cetti]|nr:TPR protein [Cettia cetti]
AEQQYFEVEKRLAQSQERLVNETQECQTLREELKKLHEQLKVLSEKNKELEAAQDRSAAVQSQLSREKEELEAEKRDLVRTTERRSQEVEHLNEDVKRLNEKLTEASTEKAKLQLKLDELQTSDVSMKYREKRLEQEKELLQNQNTWLNAELKAKTDELLHTAREKGNEILELKCSLENKKEEVSRMEEQVNSLKQSNENLQKHVEELLNKLKEAKEQQASMEERFHNELNAHIKLSNLYKACLSDLNLANKAAQEHLAEVEESKAAMEKELREKISKLEKELENANDLLSATKRKGAILSEEELAAMSPTAAAVAKVVKPGMKLTELYNAYVETQDQLHMEKLENKRINKYLDEIVQEVEAKAPILKRQREEFERSQKAVASLSAKLEQAMKEIHRLQDSADQANKHASFFERESQRLEVRVKDLSQQICVLLMELEEARGNHVIRDEAVSSADISSSSEVITQHLVSYRNIQELQQQNQRLLVALRELGEAKEKEEQETTSSK